MKTYRAKKIPKKYDLSASQRMDYEMEKIMRKNIRRFESMIQKSISEQLKDGLYGKTSGFNTKDFGESSSQFMRGLKNLFS